MSEKYFRDALSPFEFSGEGNKVLKYTVAASTVEVFGVPLDSCPGELFVFDCLCDAVLGNRNHSDTFTEQLKALGVCTVYLRLKGL